MEELLIDILDFFGKACWVEVVTENPRCIYYFGPFATKKDASAAQGGYIEDLETEGAEIISVEAKRCKPSKLTVYDDRGETLQFKKIPSFSGQSS